MKTAVVLSRVARDMLAASCADELNCGLAGARALSDGSFGVMLETEVFQALCGIAVPEDSDGPGSLPDCSEAVIRLCRSFVP